MSMNDYANSIDDLAEIREAKKDEKYFTTPPSKPDHVQKE